jgi:uncharacterized membrane protein HdeD (DUF308 family)
MFDGTRTEHRGMRIVLAVVYLLGIALSIKSVIVLGRAAPWTSAGWWLTAAYFIAVIAKATVAPAFPVSAEYAILLALTVVFVVAGVRDEAQAEPWWWPRRLGATRAERGRVGGA